jgi:hypothetical protein
VWQFQNSESKSGGLRIHWPLLKILNYGKLILLLNTHDILTKHWWSLSKFPYLHVLICEKLSTWTGGMSEASCMDKMWGRSCGWELVAIHSLIVITEELEKRTVLEDKGTVHKTSVYSSLLPGICFIYFILFSQTELFCTFFTFGHYTLNN